MKTAPFVIDRGIRVDAGLTLTASGETAVLLGYAKGAGTPSIVRISADGAPETLTVASSSALDAKLEAGVKRSVGRVVPVSADGGNAVAAVDYVQTDADKTKHLVCGLSGSNAPLTVFDVPKEGAGSGDGGAPTSATTSLIECRSIVRKGALSVLKSTLATEATAGGDGSSAVATLLLGDDVLATRTTALKGKDKASERYGFTLLGFAENTAVGRELMTARYNGNALLVQFEAGSKLRDDYTWFGTVSNGPIAIPLSDQSLLLSTVNGKNDVFLARARYEEKKHGKPEYAKPEKPETVPIPVANEHGFLTGFVGDDGRLILASTEIVAGDKRTNLHRIAPKSDAKTLEGATVATQPIGDPDESVPEARLAPLPNGDLLAVYVVFTKASGYIVKGTVLHCGD